MLAAAAKGMTGAYCRLFPGNMQLVTELNFNILIFLLRALLPRHNHIGRSGWSTDTPSAYFGEFNDSLKCIKLDDNPYNLQLGRYIRAYSR